MKAQIFYLNELQDSLYEFIVQALQKGIYQNIDPSRCSINGSVGAIDRGDSGKWANEYLTLLKTSMLFGRNFNIRVTGQDWYSYLGEYTPTPNFFELEQGSLSKLFPAVGLMGRLVLAPEGLLSSSIIVHPGVFRWCPKPLDLGGLTLTDFNDKTSIQRAADKVGRRIMVEIRKIIAAYKHKQNVPTPNLNEIAELLNVSKTYIISNKASLTFQSTSISIGIQSSACIVGRLSKVILEIHNDTDCDFDWVRVRIHGPSTSLPKPVVAVAALPKKDSSLVEFSITAAVAPFCPIEVACELSNTEEGAQPFPKVVILDVEDTKG